MKGTVDDLLTQYRAILEEMAPEDVGRGGNSRKWNRLVNRLQAVHLQLRESPEGRAGISQHLVDSRPMVRLWAATHALAWDEARARATLADLARDDPSLLGFDAKMVLREFDAGRLALDWSPGRK